VNGGLSPPSAPSAPPPALRVVLSGMVAGDPNQGGATWAVLHYALGLRRLGCELVLVEQWEMPSPSVGALERSPSAAYFREVVAAFRLEQHAALLRGGTRETVGISYDRLREACRGADILLNVSGILTDELLLDSIPVRVYLDLDPVFNQLWQASGIDMRFEGHTHFVTVGQAIGTDGCEVPSCGLDWIPTVPPVVLEHWPAVDGEGNGNFTTIGNWRGYGSIDHEGVQYGQRVHSMRQFMSLPRLADARFEVALAIHPDEKPDLEALAENGWILVDPLEAAGTPSRYASFIRGSRAELGIAKSGYVVGRSGWFSDRSACYLASGRPVLAQDTGFSRFLPSGEGLLAFSTLEEAVAGVEELARDYRFHSRRAREIAVDQLDSDKVLARLIERLGSRG
jgi:hypothetical protein